MRFVLTILAQSIDLETVIQDPEIFRKLDRLIHRAIFKGQRLLAVRADQVVMMVMRPQTHSFLIPYQNYAVLLAVYTNSLIKPAEGIPVIDTEILVCKYCIRHKQ